MALDAHRMEPIVASVEHLERRTDYLEDHYRVIRNTRDAQFAFHADRGESFDTRIEVLEAVVAELMMQNASLTDRVAKLEERRCPSMEP